MPEYRTSLRIEDLPRRPLSGERDWDTPMGILLRFIRECQQHKIGTRGAARLFGVRQSTIWRWFNLQRMPTPYYRSMMLEWFRMIDKGQWETTGYDPQGTLAGTGRTGPLVGGVT